MKLLPTGWYIRTTLGLSKTQAIWRPPYPTEISWADEGWRGGRMYAHSYKAGTILNQADSTGMNDADLRPNERKKKK